MIPAKRWHRWIALTLLGGCLPPGAQAAGPKAAPATPTDTAALRALEQRVRTAARKVMPAVVAVEAALKGSGRGPKPCGSGVLISADGLVLSQYHVSHMLDQGDYRKSRKPGEHIQVILHDGRRCEAELLGADRAHDLSLLRLLGPGPYPYTPLDDKATVRRGDGVLKVGHPLGYRPGRPPVVRFGRVLCADADSFVTDCLIAGGDSGGPLFDLDGRLVGIIRNSGVPEAVREAGITDRRVDVLSACTACPPICAKMEAMRRGEIVSEDRAAPNRTADAFGKAAVLPVERWSQGAAVRAAYRASVQPARASVVTVQDGGEAVALGTVVGADGWVVTKASLLPAEPRCRLSDGQVVAAEVVGLDPAFDVALLKVAATGLRAVAWADDAAPVAGTFVAAPGPADLPLAVGVVSVPRRDLPGPFPAHVEPPHKAPASLPEVIGSAVQGRGYWVEFAEGRAAAAGVRPGDVILTIAGKEVRCHVDLAACVRGRRAGEQVPVRLLRDGKPLDLTLTLRAERDAASLSSPRDEFPTVLEHDMPLLPQECGGPVVDLGGAALGITIARVGPHGCMAIPGDCVRRLVPELKSGKGAADWAAYRKALAARTAAPAPAGSRPGKPVTLTVDELKQRLTERRERFRSLLVEYEVVSETHVEPRLLMAWNLSQVRDYQEQHRVAFAGTKRFTQVLRPEVLPWYVPEDEVTPDPNAPPDVARAVEEERRLGAARKEKGLSNYLFARTRPEELRSLFDGSQCFVWREDLRRMTPAPDPSWYYAPVMYLAGLGLRPLDPRPDNAAMRKAQEQFWFPDNFARYQKCRVLPNEDVVDGAPCVVVEAERHDEWDGKRHAVADRIWFDPRLGFAPRQWERRVDGLLADLRRNAQFDEFAPGCWLPWESTWARGTPAWVAPELRDRPAYTYHMRLRKARVNDVPDDVFKP